MTVALRLAAVVLLLPSPGFAMDIDWLAAEAGAVFNGRRVYAGCARVAQTAELSRKVATARALANAARAKNLVVSGEEHLIDGEDGELKFTITETASAALRRTSVLHEAVVDIHGDSGLCVLVAEE